MDRLNAVLCSRNPHKARELEALLPGWTIETLDGDDILAIVHWRQPCAAGVDRV